jgi:leucyl-tRNA synthetase
VLAPEHPLVRGSRQRVGGSGSVRGRRLRSLPQAGSPSPACRASVEKEGFDTGRTAINPFTGEPVPVWVANFVLGDYGTGAVMGVPAHDERDFEFATKYRLPITVVVHRDGDPLDEMNLPESFADEGTLVHSGEFRRPGVGRRRGRG